MEQALAEKLEKRARYLLPVETAMLVECRADSGERMCELLLRHIQTCGLMEEDLCSEPYERVDFEDRVLLRCRGCDKARAWPKIRAVGYGESSEEAEQNALYALTIPDGGEERHWGRGPFRHEEESCILNRVAYAKL